MRHMDKEILKTQAGVVCRFLKAYMIKIICLCGKHVLRPRRKHCSSGCYDAAMVREKNAIYRVTKKKNYPPRNCIECGTEFPPYKKDHVCCNSECRRLHNKKIMKLYRDSQRKEKQKKPVPVNPETPIAIMPENPKPRLLPFHKRPTVIKKKVKHTKPNIENSDHKEAIEAFLQKGGTITTYPHQDKYFDTFNAQEEEDF